MKVLEDMKVHFDGAWCVNALWRLTLDAYGLSAALIAT
jgi:hypothetical protein